MTDSHLRILRTVADGDNGSWMTTTAKPATTGPPAAGAISNERPGGAGRSSRRPKRDGTMRGRGPTR